MLPQLKRNREGAAPSMDVLERESDSPSEYGPLDAICDDLCTALSVPEEKREHVKGALEALCDYIAMKDEVQDHE